MISSEIYYNQLQQKYSRKITLGLSRVQKALKLLKEPHLKLNNPCNIIGSDGKFSCLTSLKYFIEANGKKTIDTLASLKPAILNIHALGGKKMMEYALEAISRGSPETHLIAVTILTSLDNDDLSMMGLDISIKNLVSNLAKLSKELGLSGVVCSSEEIKMVRESCGKNFKIIG